MRRDRFCPPGLMAIAPQAYGGIYDAPDIRPASPLPEGTAVLQVRGPLMHHGEHWLFDSYESIKRRAAEAFASTASSVLICFDSPGGLLAGAFDAARAIRGMAQAAGKPLHAYVDGQACSAAYAIASAADKIWVSASALVGSIGVIDTLTDLTAQDVQLGLRFTFVTSGSRKTDGNPHVQTNDEAIAATQARVNDQGELFFGLVAEHRAISADDVRGLEAAILIGTKAVAAGLADEVATYEQVLAAMASDATPAAAGQSNEETMNEEEKARKALQATIDDENTSAKAKARARRALAAMNEDEDEKAEGGDDDKKEESKSKAEGDKEEAKAESEDDDKKEESKSKAKAEGDDEEEEEGAKAQAPSVFSLAKKLHSIEAERAKEKEDAERSKLLASRPDFAPEIVKTLERVSLKELKEACETWPRGNAKPGSVRASAAAASVAVTRGDGQGDESASRLPEGDARDLDVMMGLRSDAEAIRNVGTRQHLGVMNRAQAAAYAKKREAERAKETNPPR